MRRPQDHYLFIVVDVVLLTSTIKAQADNLGLVLEAGATGYVVETEQDIQTIVQALRSISDLIEISTVSYMFIFAASANALPHGTCSRIW